MTTIKGLSDKNRNLLFELVKEIKAEGYAEGFEAGHAVGKQESIKGVRPLTAIFDEMHDKQSVEEITHHGKVLRKVNREAREGDYVRPSKQKYAKLIDGEIYGPVFKGSGQLFVNGYQVYAEGHNRTISTVEVFEVIEVVPHIEKSANQQRAELIAKAKEFVGSRKREGTFRQVKKEYYVTEKSEINCVVEFVVNEHKRTVVAIARGAQTNIIHSKGIAKCMPGDVFNADIGQAIALARALQIDIPVEFLKAVQPSEVVVGMKVENLECEDVYAIEGTHGNSQYDMRHTDGSYYEKFEMSDVIENYYKIIDDTNAQYEVNS